MSRGLRGLLFCLAAAILATSAMTQTPPKVTRYVGDTLVQVNISTDGRKEITCPNRPGARFIGISDRDNRNMVTDSQSYTVDLGYTRGNLDDLQRMRQLKMGAYHCLYEEGSNVDAYSFVLTEKPNADQIPTSDIKRVGTGPAENQFQPYCRLTTTDHNDIIWELYRDNTGLFEQYSTGRMLSLTYTALSREHGNGMTIFRCYIRSNPEVIQYNWAMYSENLQIRPVRASNYENTPLPYNVRYQASITLECHGNGSTTAMTRPNWMFKADGAAGYTPVVDSPPTLELKYLTTLSTLTIQRMAPAYSGYYKCDKDEINHIVKLMVNFGDVIIKDYSKVTYPMKQNNYIVCEIPEKSEKERASFTLYRPGSPPLKLNASSSTDGFTTSFDASGNLALTFAKRSDMENARLVCSFFGSSDYTSIKTMLPTLILSDMKDGSMASYFYLKCNKDRTFDGQMNTHVLNANGSLGEALQRITQTSPTEARFYKSERDPSQFAEFVCVSQYEGTELRSNLLTFGTPNVVVDLYVEGEKNPGRRVFLGGRDVTLECHFSRVPSTRFLQPSAVSIFKDGARLPLPQEAINATGFRYVIRNAGPSDNGDYRCNYNFAGFYRAAVALVGSFASSTSNLQFCTGGQFVCDRTCKDNSLMCDKKRDCLDGADERPEYCEKCEPNEVKCDVNNGKSPSKRCVLKHWLCDGQDDCGNGYDENLSLHSKYCYKEKACNSCRSEETCCPGGSSKCIQRNYECDKENDCDGGAEELLCSPSQCLRLLKPVARSIVQKRVGERFNLTCIALGMDRPTINWRRNWAALPKDGVVEDNEVTSRNPAGGYTVLGTLQFVSLTKEMSGIYNCEAVNNCKRELSYEIDLRVSD